MAVFSAKKQKSGIRHSDTPTLVSKACTITGEVNASAFVRIDGKVKGDVSSEEGLIIGETGYVKGNIQTKELVIFGVVEGKIFAESVEIRNTGKVYGEISTGNVSIEQGAIYNGTLAMKEAKEQVTQPALIEEVRVELA